jgi:hypothetical protein
VSGLFCVVFCFINWQDHLLGNVSIVHICALFLTSVYPDVSGFFMFLCVCLSFLSSKLESRFSYQCTWELVFSSQCTVNSHAIQVVSVEIFRHTVKGGKGGG